MICVTNQDYVIGLGFNVDLIESNYTIDRFRNPNTNHNILNVKYK